MSTAQDDSWALYSVAAVAWNAHAELVLFRSSTFRGGAQQLCVDAPMRSTASSCEGKLCRGNFSSVMSGRVIGESKIDDAVACYKPTLHCMAFAKDINTCEYLNE